MTYLLSTLVRRSQRVHRGPETSLWEASNGVQDAEQSQVAMGERPFYDRIAFALWRPGTALRLYRPEKSRDLHALYYQVVRSLQCGLSRKNREIRASFAYLRVRIGVLSLQLRLRGGARGIRTPGTVLPRYTEGIYLRCLYSAEEQKRAIGFSEGIFRFLLPLLTEVL